MNTNPFELKVFRGVGGLIAAGIFCSAVRGADPVADVEAQYQRVLEVMKKPSVTGVLVTEVEPESAAAEAGIRGGDIITEYYGAKITTLRSLREQLAEAMGRQAVGDATGEHVVLRARRSRGSAGADETVAMTLPREPLGIRAVEVEAGVAGPRNPPASPRGTLTVDWKQVVEAMAAAAPAEGDGAAAAERGTTLRTVMQKEMAPTTQDAAASATRPGVMGEEWIGWQVNTAEAPGAGAGGDALMGSVDVYRIDPENPGAGAPDHSTFTFRLRIGDDRTTPVFVLDEATARYPGGAGTINAAAKRNGLVLRVQSAAADAGGPAHEYAAPLSALVQPAVPYAAAALPHQTDAVLGLYLLSVRDFLPRPGYVLATKGLQALPTTEDAERKEPEKAWRVDLMHCGVVVESYWYSDERRLLCEESAAVQPVISRRVARASDAQAPMEARAASRPATRAAGEAPK